MGTPSLERKAHRYKVRRHERDHAVKAAREGRQRAEAVQSHQHAHNAAEVERALRAMGLVGHLPREERAYVVVDLVEAGHCEAAAGVRLHCVLDHLLQGARQNTAHKSNLIGLLRKSDWSNTHAKEVLKDGVLQGARQTTAHKAI